MFFSREGPTQSSVAICFFLWVLINYSFGLLIMNLTLNLYLTIFRFPKIGVPLNHPCF